MIWLIFYFKTRFKKIRDRELCTSLYFFCMSLHVLYFCMTLHVITRHIFLHDIACHYTSHFLHDVARDCMSTVFASDCTSTVFASDCKSTTLDDSNLSFLHTSFLIDFQFLLSHHSHHQSNLS